MPDAIDMRIAGDFTKFQASNPPLFIILIQCVEIQPYCDIDAGLGVFQVPCAFMNMHLDDPQIDKLLRLVRINPWRFYVFVRAWQMASEDEARETFLKVINAEQEPDYNALINYLACELPRFNEDVVRSNVFA